MGIETRKKDVDYDGLIIPNFDVLNSNAIVEFDLRRDSPDREIDGAGQLREKRKYMKPRGSKNLLYVPPMVKAEWLTTKGKKLIILTEGPFKAMAKARAASDDFTNDAAWDFIPLAISGVDNFKTKTTVTTDAGEKLNVSAGLNEFGQIEWKGATVIICFDSDADEKPNVRGAISRIKWFFREKKVKTFNLRFPREFKGVPTKGIDDFLGAVEQKHGAAEAIEMFRQLIDEAQNPKKKSSLAPKNFELVKNGEGENPGLFFIEEDGLKSKISSPIEVLAETQTAAGENYGRLISWTDSKGRVKTLAVPVELVHSEGSELIKRLVSGGLELGVGRAYHDKLKIYINQSGIGETVICTPKLGWHDGVFVFPDETIGEGENRVIYQPEQTTDHKFIVRGTLEEWQSNVAKYCCGNPVLMFSMCIAFGAPLLPIVGVQGGGFHHRADTSIGKSTTLIAAGSAVGGSDEKLGYSQSWNTTGNALEAMAEQHNHQLLCLDELAQIDGKQAADAVYAVSNGLGKKRLSSSISFRRSFSWLLLFLSSGEISLADKMREAGLTIKGGQEVRILDIPYKGKFGIFDNLHEFSGGQDLADRLQSNSHAYCGTAIREYLRGVVDLGPEEIKKAWSEFRETFTAGILPADRIYPPEVFRAGTRFAIVAFAGEMATEMGVTKWQTGEATMAAQTVFKAWFDNRLGQGSSDSERAIAQIQAFIEAHGSSRFEFITPKGESLETGRIVNRAGFKKINSVGEIEFLFLPEVFRTEVCKGFDYKTVCKILDERGFLQHDSAGFQKQIKYGGAQIRPYWISSRILGGSQTEESVEARSAAGSAK